jgi:hypothetical protein
MKIWKKVWKLSTVLAVALSCAACYYPSPLAQVNARQLSAEEAGNLRDFLPLANAVSSVLGEYDRLSALAARAQTPEVAANARARAHALLEKVRDSARRLSIRQAEWTQIVPPSMKEMARSVMHWRAAVERLNAGHQLTDAEILGHLRAFQGAQARFRAEAAARPLQAVGYSKPSAFLYVSMRGVPVVVEPFRGEVYLGPTVPVGPFDVQAIVGPIGGSGGGTSLERLVLRDPATRTQRVFALNSRMPRLYVDRSAIDAQGTDLVVTALREAHQRTSF